MVSQMLYPDKGQNLAQFKMPSANLRMAPWPYSPSAQFWPDLDRLGGQALVGHSLQFSVVFE